MLRFMRIEGPLSRNDPATGEYRYANLFFERNELVYQAVVLRYLGGGSLKREPTAWAIVNMQRKQYRDRNGYGGRWIKVRDSQAVAKLKARVLEAWLAEPAAHA